MIKGRKSLDQLLNQRSEISLLKFQILDRSCNSTHFSQLAKLVHNKLRINRKPTYETWTNRQMTVAERVVRNAFPDLADYVGQRWYVTIRRLYLERPFPPPWPTTPTEAVTYLISDRFLKLMTAQLATIHKFAVTKIRRRGIRGNLQLRRTGEELSTAFFRRFHETID